MATTPPSPVSSWTVDGPAASDSAHPAPSLVWPSSTKSLTVHDPSRGGALHLKLAQESETLQIWLEESASKRQFYASLTNEECKAIVKDMLDPSNLLEMLLDALSTSSEAGEGLSVSFEWLAGSVILILHFLPNKWKAKPFKFPLAEREVSHVDRLERRIDDVETALKTQEAKSEQAKSVAASCMDDLRAEVQELKVQIQNLASAAQNRSDNLPAALAAQIQAHVDSLRAEFAVQVQEMKADVADTHRKKDIDQKLAAKADVADTYRKQDIDQKLAAKADAANTHCKKDIDQKLAAKASSRLAEAFAEDEII